MLNFIECINTKVDWFSTLSLLATLITAIATFWTVTEVKKQRESSYHPELYLSNQNVYFYGRKYDDIFLPFDYSTEPIEINHFEYRTGKISIELHNVGFAVSKAVSFQWEFDIKTALEQIEKNNLSDFFHIEHNIGLEIAVPQTRYKHFHMVENQLRGGELNYIMPTTVQGTPTRLYIPSCYIDLYLVHLSSALSFYQEKTEENNEFGIQNYDSKDFTPLLLNLSYRDLQGKAHLKRFKLEFSFSSITSPKSLTDDNRELGQQTLISTELN